MYKTIFSFLQVLAGNSERTISTAPSAPSPPLSAPAAHAPRPRRFSSGRLYCASIEALQPEPRCVGGPPPLRTRVSPAATRQGRSLRRRRSTAASSAPSLAMHAGRRCADSDPPVRALLRPRGSTAAATPPPVHTSAAPPCRCCAAQSSVVTRQIYRVRSPEASPEQDGPGAHSQTRISLMSKTRWDSRGLTDCNRSHIQPGRHEGAVA